MVKTLVCISVGASGGAILRWVLGAMFNAVFSPIPLGTLAANLLGGYLTGIAISLFNVTCPPKTSPFFKLVVEWTWEDGKWLRKHLPRNRLSLSFGK